MCAEQSIFIFHFRLCSTDQSSNFTNRRRCYNGIVCSKIYERNESVRKRFASDWVCETTANCVEKTEFQAFSHQLFAYVWIYVCLLVFICEKMGRKEKISTVTPPIHSQSSCPSPPPPTTSIISKRTYTRQISNNSNSNPKKTENALVRLTFIYVPKNRLLCRYEMGCCCSDSHKYLISHSQMWNVDQMWWVSSFYRV